MLEFTHETLLNGKPTAGLSPRLSSLTECCMQIARECVEAVEDGIDYFDEGGLRFAVVTDPSDLWQDGPLAAFLDVAGDPMPAVVDRLEGCHHYADLRGHVLLLSVGDTTADYVVLADEWLTSAWTQVLDDLFPVGEPAA